MEEMIRGALAAYGMAEAKTELIRHNENLTCKVEHQGSAYVLRIHCPVEGFSTALVAADKDDRTLFQGETELLRHMAQNGFDGLQQPVANLQGDYVTQLHTGAPAMLLTWVEGRPLTQEEGSKYAKELGSLACRIYRATEGFKGERLAYDSDLTDRMIAEIRLAVEQEHIAVAAGDICIRELEAAKAAQQRLSATRVVHADLSLGNILLTDRGLIPIDFSMSGYGSLAQEVGMLISCYQDDADIATVLEGVALAGEAVDAADAELFLAYSVLLFICAQHNRFYAEEWFAGALQRWCETLFIH